MAWITKKTTSTGESRYLVGWREPSTGKRIHESFHRLSDARSRKTEVERQLDRDEYVVVADRRRPLATYIKEMLKTEESLGKLKGSTLYLYRNTAKNHVDGAIGKRPIGEIKTLELERYFAGLEAPQSIKAIVYRLLSKAFEHAVARDVLVKNPLRLISKPVEVREEIIPPTPEQVLALADAADPRYRVPILVAGFAGLRGGEVGGLRIQDVDFEHRTLTVKQAIAIDASTPVIRVPKTKASRRTIPIGSLADEIASHVAEFPPAEDGRLFTTNGHRGLLSSVRFNRAVATAAKRIGMDPIPNAHQLRHSFASMVIQAKGSPKQLMRYMGHSKISVTMDTYAALWPGDLDEVAEATDRIRLRARVPELPGSVDDVRERPRITSL
jgi:integrase